jgi:signal transduction histidine kinase
VSHEDERVLIFAPTGRDGALTRELLGRSGFGAVTCASIADLSARMDEGVGAVLLAEETLLPAAVARLAENLAAQPPWSDLPIVIFTGAGATIQSKRPTLEMLAPLGNVTLLDRPVRIATLLSAIRSALRARGRQYAARDVMLEQKRAVVARDQFLAMLGHELRNPLGAISLATALLESKGDGVKHREVLKRQTAHMTRLVDDLLDVARVTAGKIALRRVPVDVADVARRAVTAHEPAARTRAQTVELQIAREPLMVDADLVRIEQVVANLLGNAVKYTPSGGRIVVSVGTDGADAVLAVEDDGVGIAPEVLPQIFDLFSQAERTLDRAQGGLGIGLTLVHRLVELHGGEVSAESEGVGKGARFTVRLPRVVSVASQPPPPSNEGATGPRRRVLVVEDMADHREILREFVASLGHEVEVAEDGLDGLAQARRFHADVMVVDIGLPGIDGYELARRIRAERGNEVKLIAVTGYGQPDDRRRALDAGFDLHLTKPIDVKAMQTAIEATAA